MRARWPAIERMGAIALRRHILRREAYWRRCLRMPPILRDRTFPCDVIRREHSPPISSILSVSSVMANVTASIAQ